MSASSEAQHAEAAIAAGANFFMTKPFNLTTLKDGRRVEHFETERVRADGRRVLISLSVAPIKDGHGNVVGASKIARDVTRERQAEADLRKLANELSEADRRKDEFLATLAHELRGPLAPLSNVLALWKRSASAEWVLSATCGNARCSAWPTPPTMPPI